MIGALPAGGLALVRSERQPGYRRACRPPRQDSARRHRSRRRTWRRQTRAPSPRAWSTGLRRRAAAVIRSSPRWAGCSEMDDGEQSGARSPGSRVACSPSQSPADSTPDDEQPAPSNFGRQTGSRRPMSTFPGGEGPLMGEGPRETPADRVPTRRSKVLCCEETALLELKEHERTADQHQRLHAISAELDAIWERLRERAHHPGRPT